MADNYRVWSTDSNEFYKLRSNYEKLKFLLNYAAMAPSSHNSQPWKFKIEEDTIIVMADKSRALPVSDPTGRQMYISLGCAITNLVIAADYFGLNPSQELLAGYSEGDGLRIRLGFENNTGGQDSTDSFLAISRRASDRGGYLDRPLSRSFLEGLRMFLALNSIVRVDYIQDQDEKNRVADITLNALNEAMSRNDFRKELSGYVKNNLTGSGVGMPGFTLKIPAPVSFIASRLVRFFNLAKLSRKADEKLLKKQTPAFGVISIRGDSVKEWIIAGSLFQVLALEAEQENLRTSVLAAPIEIGSYYNELRSVLDIDSEFRPQVFFRIGYSNNKVMHSPRLNVEQILVEEDGI